MSRRRRRVVNEKLKFAFIINYLHSPLSEFATISPSRDQFARVYANLICHPPARSRWFFSHLGNIRVRNKIGEFFMSSSS